MYFLKNLRKLRLKYFQILCKKSRITTVAIKLELNLGFHNSKKHMVFLLCYNAPQFIKKAYGVTSHSENIWHLSSKEKEVSKIVVSINFSTVL